MLYMWKMCGLKVLLSHRVTGLGNWQFFARDGALEKVKTKTYFQDRHNVCHNQKPQNK